MEFKKPTPLRKRYRKRRAKKHGDEETSSESEDSKPCSSNQRKRNSSGSEKKDEESYSSPLSSEEGGNFSASSWNSKDLKYLNILFDETNKPLEDFIKEIKDSVEKKIDISDPSKVINVLTRHMNELMPFSFDLTTMRKWQNIGILVINELHKEPKRYEESMLKSKSEELLQDNQDYQALDPMAKTIADRKIRQLETSVEQFAEYTSKLIDKVMEEIALESEKKKRKVENPELQATFEDKEWNRTFENDFQLLCTRFARLFFLEEGTLIPAVFTFRNKTVRDIPDLVYHFYREGNSRGPDQLFFLIEVKKSAVHSEIAQDINTLVGESIMGRLGSELIGQAGRSLFFPNSLGILCMETKLIFVFLKMSLEHSVGIRVGEEGSADDPGMIMYTEPFDMLKQEDRLKIADFMFWLGYVQKRKRYSL